MRETSTQTSRIQNQNAHESGFLGESFSGDDAIEEVASAHQRHDNIQLRLRLEYFLENEKQRLSFGKSQRVRLNVRYINSKSKAKDHEIDFKLT